ncbi:MAG TPA: tyrosine-type recombinase/integrase [candidate division Zixibacteria bacterium]|nr:tyrosine-type recombinase/integrase [candidate division Zixibacteria bacterium]
MMVRNKDVVSDYQEYLEQTGKSANTVKAYVHDVGAFASWFEQTTGDEFAPGIVDPREITDYRGHLLQRGSSPATVNRRLVALRRYFLWAKKQGMISDTPFEMLERVRVKEQKDVAPRWLTRNEQLALLRTVRQGENQRDLAIVQVMLGAGLRISEAAALKVSDIELNDRSGWVKVRVGKGMKSRSIPLSIHVRNSLEAYLNLRTDEDEEDLFLGQRGPLSEWGIHAIVKKYAYQARQEDVTAHTLRHSFAKNLVDAGTPLDQVAVLLGHESLDTTRIYTQPSERDLERAVQRAAGEIIREDV